MQLGDENMGITLFEQQPVRRIWHDDRWFYSVIDTVAVLTESQNPRVYWAKLKERMVGDEGARQVLTLCQQLKLRAPDGKMRETDCADTETLLRIIQSIPSPKAEPFKQWLAGLGADVIEDRTEDQRRIEYREQGIVVKRRLHDEVHGRGVHSRKAHAEMEGRGHVKLYGGETPSAAKERKKIDEDEDLGEWMGSEEIIDNSFRDAQSRAYIKRLDIKGKEPVIEAHERVSEEVRRFIIEDLGGTPPELLPTPTKSLSQIRKEEERRRLKGMDLFPEQDELPQTAQPDDIE